MKNVGIVVLNYKKWEDTIECLNSIKNSTCSNYKIIVVDNNSNNNSIENINDWWAKQYSDSIEKVNDKQLYANNNKTFFSFQSLENKGYAVGNNIGIKLAIEQNCDYILILNPDTQVTNNFLNPMVKFLNNNKDVAMVGPKIITPANSIDYVCSRKRPTIWDYIIPTYVVRYFFKGLSYNKYNPVLYSSDVYLSDKPQSVDIISGACMLIKSDILEKIGFFDKNTFLYLEELILHEKLLEQNKKTFYIPESVIIHKQGSSTSLDSWLFIRKEYLKSLNYYLLEYRKFNSFLRMFILLNVSIFQSFNFLKSYIKNILKH